MKYSSIKIITILIVKQKTIKKEMSEWKNEWVRQAGREGKREGGNKWMNIWAANGLCCRCKKSVW